ncbi:MAG: haloacid dehalogenase type II [Candidatus Sulfotelmatobacter sp.]
MLDFSRFELLTFDCYGTLVNWEEGILGCISRILSTHGKNIDDATILKFYGDFEARAEQGEYHSYREVLQSVVRQFGEQLGFAASEQEAGSLPDSLKDWKPWPDTVKALHELRNRFQLAIISNVDDNLFAATRPKLEVEFTQVITAQQAQAYKPSSKIFELALRRVGVPARRILHVGQSLYHDVIPAQSLGLATVWVNRPSARSGVGAVKIAEGHPDLQVQSLAELATIADGREASRA